jgi:hypothetical protein
LFDFWLSEPWIRTGSESGFDPGRYSAQNAGSESGSNEYGSETLTIYVSHLVHSQSLQEATGDAMIVRMRDARHAYRRLLQDRRGLAVAAQRDGMGPHPGSVPVGAFAERFLSCGSVTFFWYGYGSTTLIANSKSLGKKTYYMLQGIVWIRDILWCGSGSDRAKNLPGTQQ